MRRAIFLLSFVSSAKAEQILRKPTIFIISRQMHFASRYFSYDLCHYYPKARRCRYTPPMPMTFASSAAETGGELDENAAAARVTQELLSSQLP